MADKIVTLDTLEVYHDEIKKYIATVDEVAIQEEEPTDPNVTIWIKPSEAGEGQLTYASHNDVENIFQ